MLITTRSKMTQATFTRVPRGSASPLANRIRPTAAATASSTDTTICGWIRLQLGPPLWRALGVTAKPRGRPNQTFRAAVEHALIQVGNRARLYCWPRHVG